MVPVDNTVPRDTMQQEKKYVSIVEKDIIGMEQPVWRNVHLDNS